MRRFSPSCIVCSSRDDVGHRTSTARLIAGLAVAVLTLVAGAGGVAAQPEPRSGRGKNPPYARADAWLAAQADTLRAVNSRIWSHPEVGLQERRAADELVTLLERSGFTVERGVAGMPTAFVATAGNGRPIIGILAEFDALPGTSQAASPERRRREVEPENDAGHACGHSVFGTASCGAAAAAWDVAHAAGIPGTIRVYGTPAEETGIGKVYMARAGLFDDLDAAFHWHAGDKTRVSFSTSKTVISVKYRFDGTSAHSSMSPEAGRSALDAVELMNIGANFLREHLREDARIHYVITDGGGQPNVVPPTAEVWYYLRADRHTDAERMLERVRNIAQGAALMTGTTTHERIDSDTFELLPNEPLSKLLQRHLDRVGPPQFEDAEREFAARTQVDLEEPQTKPLADAIDPLPEAPWHIRASTDVGNVSWAVPTGGLNVACYTLGAPGHSWQVVACTGMSIGEKGMFVAARTLAGATLELLASPALVVEARRDFDARRGATPNPVSVLAPDQTTPVTIR